MKKLLTFVSILFIYSASSFADQGVSDDEIMLGMHTDISGPVSSFGKYSVEGAKTVSYTHLTLPTTPYV